MGRTTNQSRSFSEAILRRPLLSAATFFILGIFAHAHLPPRPVLWLTLATALLALSILARSIPSIPDVLLAAALFLAGTTTAHLESFFYPPRHIAHFTASAPRLARLELRITQPPRTISSNITNLRRLPPRQVTQAQVLRILTTTGWQPAAGAIQLQFDEPLSSLAIAQHISAIGQLARPLPPSNPGQFDWANYYRDQRILASLHIRHPRNVNTLAAPRPNLLDSLRQSVRSTLQRGFAPEKSLDHALLRALVLGDSDPQLRDVQDDFTRTGTSHHLAISGMHITVLGALVLGLCRILLLSPRISVWISLLFVILYGLLALPSPPVVRSVLLCIAFAIGILSRRSLDGIQLLALSVFLVLIYHPFDLYNAGFQLSFGTVLGLMFFAKPAIFFFEDLRDRNKKIADLVHRPAFLEGTMRNVRLGLLECTVATTIAWLVSAPLIAFHFNQINPYTIPASLLLAIPVFLALIGGFLKIVLTLLFPPLACLFADIAALPVALMRHMVDLLAKIPNSDAPFAQPPLWSILLFYLLLALPLLPRPRIRFTQLLRAGPALACLLVLTLPLLLASAPSAPAPGQLHFTLLSVGTGQCAILRLPAGKTILIDAGSASISDLSRNCLTPYLKSLGLRQIDSLFLSHANYDHFSAATDAVVNHDIQHVHLSPLFHNHAAHNPPAQSLLQTLASLRRDPQILSAGQRLALDPHTTLDVLWPPTDQPLDPNESSLVLRLTCHGQSILFPGDIQDLAQVQLLANPDRLQSDILIAPHHGSSVPSTALFLAAVNPKLILASNDHTLTSKQRHFDTLAATRPLYRTHQAGAITLTISPDRIFHLTTFLTPSPKNPTR